MLPKLFFASALILPLSHAVTNASNDVLDARSISEGSDALVGLMLNKQPNTADDLRAVEIYANSIWCNELGRAETPADREQKLKSIQARMKNAAANSSGKVSPY